MPKRLLRFLPPLVVLALAIALFLWQPLPLTLLRNLCFDQFQRWHPRPVAEAPVAIVDIDDGSLSKLGQWPWPRTRIAALVDQLRQAGAAAVVFDVVFAEPDRTSPAAMKALWQLPPQAAATLAGLPDHDAALADAIGAAPVVLGMAADSGPGGGVAPAPGYNLITRGEAPLPYLHGFSRITPPLLVLAAKAAGHGVLSFVPDQDGVVRRVPLLVRQGGRVLPSLVAEALRVAQGERNYLVRTAEPAGTGIAEVRIGALAVPTTPQGELWVHYAVRPPGSYLPAWRVMAGGVPAQRLAGKIVLVGTSAQGLLDVRFSPLGGVIPGMEAHAQALEQILTDHYLLRPGWAEAIEGLALVVGGVLLLAVGLGLPALPATVLALTLIGGLLGGAWWAFLRQGLLLDPVTPSLGLLLVFLAASLTRHVLSERQERWLRDAFSHYVSPNRVGYLVDHPGQLALGGRRQTCSFIFTDLQGFTAMMEQIDPARAVALLNDYLDGMIGIAFRHGGTLDRIVGDAVAIMFSAPVEQPQHPLIALACALEMHAFAHAYAQRVQAQGMPFGETRIGVHAGEVIVGNFGGSTMFDYRALGDPVNTASRLEGLNKHLGTLVCVSEEIAPHATGLVALRPVGDLVLKGKTQALAVYEPITDATGQPLQARDADYDAAYALLEGDDLLAARQAFAALHEARPEDGLVGFRYARLAAGASGVRIVMQEK